MIKKIESKLEALGLTVEPAGEIGHFIKYGSMVIAVVSNTDSPLITVTFRLPEDVVVGLTQIVLDIYNGNLIRVQLSTFITYLVDSGIVTEKEVLEITKKYTTYSPEQCQTLAAELGKLVERKGICENYKSDPVSPVSPLSGRLCN